MRDAVDGAIGILLRTQGTVWQDGGVTWCFCTVHFVMASWGDGGGEWG